MRIGATVFNQNCTDWDRFEAGPRPQGWGQILCFAVGRNCEAHRLKARGKL